MALIGKLSDDFVKDISKDAGYTLKSQLKTPGVLLCTCAGLLAGFALVMCKSGGEILYGAHSNSERLLCLPTYFMGFGAAILQVYMINLSMKFYN